MTRNPSAPVALVAPNGITAVITAAVGVARLHRPVPTRARRNIRVLVPTILATIIGTIAPTAGTIRSRVHRRTSSRARPSDRFSPSFRARSIIPGAWAARATWYPSNSNSRNRNRSQPRTATFGRAEKTENVVGFSAEGGVVSSLWCPLWLPPRTPLYGHSRGRRCPCPRRIPRNHRPAVPVIRPVRPGLRSSRTCTRRNPQCECLAPTRVPL